MKKEKKVTEENVEETVKVDEKAQELLAMKATLEHLVHCCNGDDRPECPILESLSADLDEAPTKTPVPRKARKGAGNGRRDAAIN